MAISNCAQPTEAVRHVNAVVKVDMLQEMIEERVAVRRMEERRENWRQYNAATFIKVDIIMLYV